MSKVDKKEVNPQVKKANASAIKKHIKHMCEQVPLEFDFERTSGRRAQTNPNETDFYNKPVFTNTWTHNHQRSSFIYTVIHQKMYYEQEGQKLGVSTSEIYSKFTQLIYSLAEIEGFTERKAFDAYLFKCYQEMLEEEQEERTTYLQATLLDQLLLLNSTPDLVYRSLQSIGNSIKSVSSELDMLHTKLKFREIEPSEYGELRNPLDEKLTRLRAEQEYLLAKYKRMVETDKYRRRKFLSMAFRNATLSLNQAMHDPIDCNKISLCNFYITEYCRWFNKKFSEEIRATQKWKAKEERKKKRNSDVEADPRLLKLQPYLGKGLSFQALSDATGIAKSTVRGLLKNAA